jgi:hypothetical protein
VIGFQVFGFCTDLKSVTFCEPSALALIGKTHSGAPAFSR